MTLRNNLKSKLRPTLLILGLLLTLGAAVAGSALAEATPNTHPSSIVHRPSSIEASLEASLTMTDAYLEFRPQAGGPPNGGTVVVGQRFVLDLFLNSGTNAPPDGTTAQQSYLTFSWSLLKVLTATAPCPQAFPNGTVINTDSAIFDAVLQNETCNGPDPCNFRGVTVNPGSFAFASGALANCPEGCEGEFRVASVHLCAIAPGTAIFHWQFTPPDPIVRDTEIVLLSGFLAQDRARINDYIINVLPSGSPTVTPGITSTPTITRSPTITPTRTITPIPAITSTPTSTPTTTLTQTSTRTSTPTVTGTPPTLTPTPTGTPPTATSTWTSTPTATPTVTGTPPTVTPTPTDTGTPCPMTFTDVQRTDYFYEPVRALYCRGVISGYSDNTFRPFNNTTRAQLCKIVVLAEGWTINVDGGPHFTDVPEDHTFYTFIETAYNRGVIAGYSDDTFRPGNNVTRGQLCKIIVLAEQWSVKCPTEPRFTDVLADNPFYCLIETAYVHNIITGYADRTFRPANPATRGQICKIVFAAISNP